MSEDKPRQKEIRREVRGPPPGGLRPELEGTASGGELGFDLQAQSGIPTSNTPLSTPGELSEGKDSFEIDENCHCGSVPELDVDKGEVGAWRFQVVYCSECMYRYGAAVTPIQDDEEVGEDGD